MVNGAGCVILQFRDAMPPGRAHGWAGPRLTFREGFAVCVVHVVPHPDELLGLVRARDKHHSHAKQVCCRNLGRVRCVCLRSHPECLKQTKTGGDAMADRGKAETRSWELTRAKSPRIFRVSMLARLAWRARGTAKAFKPPALSGSGPAASPRA